jgi:hypothetical protein
MLMPQFLCSQAHIVAGWRLETQLTLRCHLSSIIFDCRLMRLPHFFSLYSLYAAPTENTVSIVIAQQYFNCCLLIHWRGSLFTESLPSNERLLWLRYSGFQASCHNIPKLSTNKSNFRRQTSAQNIKPSEFMRSPILTLLPFVRT